MQQIIKNQTCQKKKKNRDKRTHRENQLPGRNAQLNTSLKQRSEDAKTLVSEHKTHYQRKKRRPHKPSINTYQDMRKGNH